MNSYVIGIDGGASKTHLALFGTDGILRDFRHWGPMNPDVLEGRYAGFEKELGQLISETLHANNLTPDQIAYSVVGMAGVDTNEQHRIVAEIITKQGLRDFALINDAYIGIFAGSPSGVGICAINGSGCTIAGINKEGKSLQIGGLGDATGDFGGGTIMGAQAVSAVYNSLFRMGDPTLLTKLLFQKLGITDKHELPDHISKMQWEGRLGSCNSLLFEAVRQNDGVAIEILRNMAKTYANGITHMIKALIFEKSEPLHIILAGSVFVKAEHPMPMEMLGNYLGAGHSDYQIQYSLLDKPTVAGAVIRALSTLDADGDYFEKVRSQL